MNAGSLSGSEFTAIETNTPGIDWTKIIGGSGAETGSDIVPTPDGGYIILATTSSDDGDVGANFGGFDLYVEKMSADGAREWKTVLGGSDYDAGSSITPTEDGGYILLANTLSDKTMSWTGTAGSGNFKITNHGNWDMLVVKLLSDGRPSWTRTYGGSLGESDEYHASAIRELHDGNFIIVGSTNSPDWLGKLPSPKDNFTSLGVIFKITPTGDMIWSRTLGFVPEGTKAQTFFGDVAEREDGSLVAVGFTSAPGMIPVDHVSSDPYKGTDGLIAQYTAEGTPMKWPFSSKGENYLTFGGVDHDEFAAIEQTDDDGFILVGTSKSDSHGQGDVWVVRINKDGKAEWDKRFGGSDWDTGTSVRQVPGAYLVSGATYSDDGDVTSNLARESFWLLRLTGADGSLQWQQTFAGPGDESYCADAWSTADAGYIMVGSTSNRDGQPVNDSNTGGQKAWIVKLTTNLRKEIVNTPLSPAGADTTGRADPGQVIPHGGRVLHYSPSPVGRPNTTIVYAPMGNNQYRAEFYAEDPEATQYIVFPTGASYPATIIHYVPSGSTVTSLRDYQADVLDPGTGSVTFNLTEDRWYDESASAKSRSLPRGMCIAGAGCSVGNSAKQHLFLSSPLPSSGNATPVFSVRGMAGNQWIGTMGTLGSSDPKDVETMIVEKDILNPGQQINFTVLGDPETGSGLSLYVTEQAGLTSENAVLQYSGVATSSVPLPSMTLTPRIWKHAASGDVLVYTGTSKACMNVPECRLSGTFVPLWDISNVTATYFANITTIYTMPQEIRATNPGVPAKLAMIQNSVDDEPVPEVVVTGPLSPVPPGTAASAENVNNTVPWGGTVEHVMDGDVPTTIVYDTTGQPQYRADDRMATTVLIPGGSSMHASHVFSLPDSTIIEQTGTITNVTLFNGNPNPILIVDSKNRSPVINELGHDQYVEGFSQTYSGTVGSYSAKWTIPTSPSHSSTLAVVHIWNGLHNHGAGGLIQPVLSWNMNRQTAGKWTGNAWAIAADNSYQTGTQTASLSAGDLCEGTMEWDQDMRKWKVQFKDTTNSEVATLWSDVVHQNNVDVMDILEGAGTQNTWNSLDPTYLPGDITLTSHSLKSPSGVDITPSSVTCEVNPVWSRRSGFNELGTSCGSWPNTITLNT